MNVKSLSCIGLMILGGCSSEWDMYGKDPKDYYRDHPIKNKVERRNESRQVFFAPGSSRLSQSDIESLRGALRHVSPMAVESVQLQVHPSQQGHTARNEYIRKLLRSMGYKPSAVMIEPTDTVKRDEMRIDLSYASVVSPRCPDWRASPTTTYSNTQQGGWSCAYVNNMGQMIADPRDLERGSGASSPDARRNSEVLSGYHSNQGSGDSASGGSSGASNSSGGSPTQATGP